MSTRSCAHCTTPAPATVALLGGTFDPPHRGHLALAEAAAEHADQLWWVPVGTPTHRPAPRAPVPLRLAMCAALAEPRPRMRVCAADTAGASGRTVDLLAALHRTHPGTRLRLVLGADQAVTLHRWDGAERILELADLIVAPRAGHRLPDHLFDTLPPSARLLDLARTTSASSTAVRSGRLDLLDPAVARLWLGRDAA